MMPRSLKLLWPPVIVNVFPLSVCPHANTVPLKQSSAPSMIGRATASNIASCFVPVSNVWLNVNSKWSRELLMTPGAASTGTSNVILRSSSAYLCRPLREGNIIAKLVHDAAAPTCYGMHGNIHAHWAARGPKAAEHRDVVVCHGMEQKQLAVNQ